MRGIAALSAEDCCPAVASGWDTTARRTAGQLSAHVQTNNTHKIAHKFVRVNREKCKLWIWSEK
jgi:hypothetical protein